MSVQFLLQFQMTKGTNIDSFESLFQYFYWITCFAYLKGEEDIINYIVQNCVLVTVKFQFSVVVKLKKTYCKSVLSNPVCAPSLNPIALILWVFRYFGKSYNWCPLVSLHVGLMFESHWCWVLGVHVKMAKQYSGLKDAWFACFQNAFRERLIKPSCRITAVRLLS